MARTSLARIILSTVIFVSAIADTANASDLFVLNRTASASVLRFDSTTGAFLGTFVPAGSGGLSYANDLTFGPDGNLYISQKPGADYITSTVLRYNGTTGDFIDVFVPPGSGSVNTATAIRFGRDGNLYVADFNDGIASSGDVKRFNGTTGAFIDAFTSGYGMSHPSGLTFGPDGNLYVSDEANIVRFNGTTGEFMNVFAPGGSDGLPVPPCGPADQGLAFGPDGNLYASIPYCDTIARYNGLSGAFINFFVSAGSGGLAGPNAFAFGPDANLYVADGDNGTGQVFRFNGVTGEFMTVLVTPGTGGLTAPGSLTFGPPSTPLYHVCLLFDPTKAVHSGSTIPIKIELCDAGGNSLSSSDIIVHAVSISQVSTTISGVVQNAGNSNPDSNFRFDSTLGAGGGYIFNLSTTGLRTGTYNLDFKAGADTFLYAVQFQVK
jgi:hypothetical protein